MILEQTLTEKFTFLFGKRFADFYEANKNEINYEFVFSCLGNCDTVNDAKAILKTFTGGLGAAGKMPCMTYSLDAKDCKRGSKLAKVKGTVCEGCYGFRGNYNFPAVTTAQESRLNKILKNPYWKEGMICSILIFNQGLGIDENYFRWHDVGDIQNEKHLLDIIYIAKELPMIKFWLPTHEKGIIYKYANEIPVNLIVRLSGDFIGERKDINIYSEKGFLTSAVYRPATKKNPNRGIPADFFKCHASFKESKSSVCGMCRACWNKDVKTVVYRKH